MSLRNLTRTRIYRDRSSATRRSLPNDFFVTHTSNGTTTTLDWDVLTQNAEEDDVDVEEELGQIAPNDGVNRFTTSEATYQPFADSATSNTTIRRSFPVQTSDPGVDDDSSMQQLGYPTRRSPPAHFSLARHSSLSRQSSIRRHPRSRTNDFNEFTTRRRPSGRHDQSSQPSSSRTSTSGAGESSSSMDIANLLHTHHHHVNMEEGDVHIATFDTGIIPRRGATRLRSSDERDGANGGSSSNARLAPITLHSSGSSASAAPSSSRLHIHAPRLRRGGVRAPEQYAAAPAVGDGYTHTVRISSPPIPGLHSLSREEDQRLPLLRRSSSAEMEYIIQTASERFGSRSPTSSSPSLWSGNSWNATANPSGGNAGGSGVRQQSGTPTNLPTPRSISPEGSSARD